MRMKSNASTIQSLTNNQQGTFNGEQPHATPCLARSVCPILWTPCVAVSYETFQSSTSWSSFTLSASTDIFQMTSTNGCPTVSSRGTINHPE
ncbi:Uncharacterized protein HZ326_24421 [Fusarium oxysporum f. sp. albedinis]|nr:Uncharacterized protein HZ326_24421 [Fusarium oxysporum f. sp. albedinis]